MGTKGVLITIIIALVFVFASWYLSSNYIKKFMGSEQDISNAEDTTASILSDFNHVPDDSSVNVELNSLNQDLQSF